MSYILDALKKSEMERRAGAFVGLSPGASYGLAPDEGDSGSRGAAILAAVAMLGIGLALGMWRPWHTAAAASPVPAALPATAPSIPPAPPPAMPAAALAPQASSPESQASPPQPQEIEPPAPEKAVSVIKERITQRPQAAAAKSLVPVARAAAGPAAAVAAMPAESAGRIVAYGDLPAEVRDSLPKISFGGYAGVDGSEARVAFINDRLVKEGEEVSPGVRLEAVGQEGAVLGFQGYRFRPMP